MFRKWHIVLAGWLLVIGADQARTETLSLVAIADANVRAGNPTNNYGNLPTLRVGATTDTAQGSGIKRAFVAFDLSSIPVDAIVTNAVFRAFQSDTLYVTTGFGVWTVVENWGESQITWNTQPAVTNLLGVMAMAEDSPVSFASSNLTRLVQEWVTGTRLNFGLSFRVLSESGLPGPSGSQGDTISSRENTTNAPPTLHVEFVIRPRANIESLDSSNVRFSWAGQSNAFYQIHHATNLNQTVWTNLGSPVLATNLTLYSVQPTATETQGYYRVIKLP